MNCAELDILICDYVDGALGAAERAQVERHLSECPSCAELVRDCQATVSFIERVPEVEPPRELMTRLVFASAPAAKQARGFRAKYLRWLEPVLQPRFAMGMAMTILSFSMIGRFVNVPVRQLQPKDLNPVAVWAVLDDRVHRAWERGVKYYESMRLFVELKSQYRELTSQDEESRRQQAQPAAADPKKSGETSKEPGRTKQ